jgi:hypothetical protein
MFLQSGCVSSIVDSVNRYQTHLLYSLFSTSCRGAPVFSLSWAKFIFICKYK